MNKKRSTNKIVVTYFDGSVYTIPRCEAIHMDVSGKTLYYRSFIISMNGRPVNYYAKGYLQLNSVNTLEILGKHGYDNQLHVSDGRGSLILKSAWCDGMCLTESLPVCGVASRETKDMYSKLASVVKGQTQAISDMAHNSLFKGE